VDRLSWLAPIIGSVWYLCLVSIASGGVPRAWTATYGDAMQKWQERRPATITWPRGSRRSTALAAGTRRTEIKLRSCHKGAPPYPQTARRHLSRPS